VLEVDRLGSCVAPAETTSARPPVRRTWRAVPPPSPGKAEKARLAGAPRISVVIPTLNEAANLKHVLPELPEGLHEVVLVDGGSNDGTCEAARDLRPDIRVISQSRSGKGNALACGFAACTGDIIVMLDADGSADPAEIPSFVDALLAGADFAKGTRFAGRGGSADITRLRDLGNQLLTGFVNLTCRTRYSDLCYGYNAFWAATCLPALGLDWQSPVPETGDGRMLGDGFEIETLINVRIAAAGLKVTEVPSYERPRLHGVSNLNAASDGLRVLRTILTERRRAATQTDGRAVWRPAQPRVAAQDSAAGPAVSSPPRPSDAGHPTRDSVHQKDSSGPYVRELPAGTGDEVGGGLAHRVSARVVADASAIVCAYTEERWENVVAAVESLRRQTVPPAEIILAIDHNERLFERAQSLRGVTTIRNSRAPGASGSRDSAVAVAQQAIAAFLDDDAVADPDWLEHLLRGYADPNVAGVGGSIVPEWPAGRPAWFPHEFDWVVGCTYRGLPETTGRVRNLIGANMSVRRDVLERVGGFREGYGNVKSQGGVSWAGESRASSCEETELCIRVSQSYPDLRWVYEPRARVHHQVPHHRTTWRYFLSRSREEGLAKAALVSVVGRESALHAEQSYTRQILPAGVAKGLHDAAVRRDIDGIRRACAIVAGLSLTGAGFLEGMVTKAA